MCVLIHTYNKFILLKFIDGESNINSIKDIEKNTYIYRTINLEY